MASIIRRIRTRPPTCRSTGFGAFFAISTSYAAVGCRASAISITAGVNIPARYLFKLRSNAYISRPRLRPAGAPAPEYYKNKRERNHAGRRGVAKACIGSGRQRGRKGEVEDVFHPERRGFEDAAERVDNCRNASIGGPHKREALLNGAQPGLCQVLVRAWTGAEPAVIGEVEHPGGALACRHDFTGEDDLVAQQRNGIGGARHDQGAPPNT